MGSPVGESSRARGEGIGGLLGEKDCVAGGLGELLDAGGDVDGVADQRELQLASAADGARDHHTGVDPDADPKRAAESLADQAVDHHRGVHRGVGVIGQIVGGAEHRQRAVAEELVDMSAGVDDGRHHDLEQRVEPRDGVLGGVGLGERGEVADVDEHHRHLAALTGEHVVTLLEQPCGKARVDIGAERRLKSLPLSQTRLHPVERRRQRAQIIVLNHRQALTVIACRNTFGSFGKVANG